MMQDAAAYETNQDRNAVTRFLHSIRYRRLSDAIARASVDGRVRVCELGYGTGRSLDVIRRAAPGGFDYVGFDFNEAFQKACRDRYPSSLEFRLLDLGADRFADSLPWRPDIIIALETLEHVPPAAWHSIARQANELNAPMLVSVPNEVGPAIVAKNAGSWMMGYSRWKDYGFTNTVRASFGRFDSLPRHRGGHIGFDWRALMHALRQYFDVSVGTSPFRGIPRSISPSIYFTCTPDPRRKAAP